MNKMTARYLKIRPCVLFLASPKFYIVAYGLAFLLIGISGRDGITATAVWWFWGLMKDFSSNVFLAGTGEHQRDVHLMLTFLLPSLIAYAWWLVEKVTGFQGYLERRGLIN